MSKTPPYKTGRGIHDIDHITAHAVYLLKNEVDRIISYNPWSISWVREHDKPILSRGAKKFIDFKNSDLFSCDVDYRNIVQKEAHKLSKVIYRPPEDICSSDSDARHLILNQREAEKWIQIANATTLIAYSVVNAHLDLEVDPQVRTTPLPDVKSSISKRKRTTNHSKSKEGSSSSDTVTTAATSTVAPTAPTAPTAATPTNIPPNPTVTDRTVTALAVLLAFTAAAQGHPILDGVNTNFKINDSAAESADKELGDSSEENGQIFSSDNKESSTSISPEGTPPNPTLVGKLPVEIQAPEVTVRRPRTTKAELQTKKFDASITLEAYLVRGLSLPPEPLAAFVGISYYHFHRSFKKYVGVTIADYTSLCRKVFYHNQDEMENYRNYKVGFNMITLGQGSVVRDNKFLRDELFTSIPDRNIEKTDVLLSECIVALDVKKDDDGNIIKTKKGEENDRGNKSRRDRRQNINKLSVTLRKFSAADLFLGKHRKDKHGYNSDLSSSRYFFDSNTIGRTVDPQPINTFVATNSEDTNKNPKENSGVKSTTQNHVDSKDNTTIAISENSNVMVTSSVALNSHNDSTVLSEDDNDRLADKHNETDTGKDNSKDVSLETMRTTQTDNINLSLVEIMPTFPNSIACENNKLDGPSTKPLAEQNFIYSQRDQITPPILSVNNYFLLPSSWETPKDLINCNNSEQGMDKALLATPPSSTEAQNIPLNSSSNESNTEQGTSSNSNSFRESPSFDVSANEELMDFDSLFDFSMPFLANQDFLPEDYMNLNENDLDALNEINFNLDNITENNGDNDINMHLAINENDADIDITNKIRIEDIWEDHDITLVDDFVSNSDPLTLT